MPAGHDGSTSARRPPGIGPASSIGSPITFQRRPSVARADRNRDRGAGVDAHGAAREAVGRVHRDGADAVVAEVLLHLRDQRAARVAFGDLDLERGIDLGEPVGEDGVDDDALDLDDPARVRAV